MASACECTLRLAESKESAMAVLGPYLRYTDDGGMLDLEQIFPCPPCLKESAHLWESGLPDDEQLGGARARAEADNLRICGYKSAAAWKAVLPTIRWFPRFFGVSASEIKFATGESPPLCVVNALAQLTGRRLRLVSISFNHQRCCWHNANPAGPEAGECFYFEDTPSWLWDELGYPDYLRVTEMLATLGLPGTRCPIGKGGRVK